MQIPKSKITMIALLFDAEVSLLGLCTIVLVRRCCSLVQQWFICWMTYSSICTDTTTLMCSLSSSAYNIAAGIVKPSSGLTMNPRTGGDVLTVIC